MLLLFLTFNKLKTFEAKRDKVNGGGVKHQKLLACLRRTFVEKNKNRILIFVLEKILKNENRYAVLSDQKDLMVLFTNIFFCQFIQSILVDHVDLKLQTSASSLRLPLTQAKTPAR